MTFIITGAAGFIGAALIRRLLTKYPDADIVAIDNINSYYPRAIKYTRLKALGFEKADIKWNSPIVSAIHPNLTFIRQDISKSPITVPSKAPITATDPSKSPPIRGDFESPILNTQYPIPANLVCIHLAAQAGVRHSIDHPKDYIECNIRGFLNVLEFCRHNNVAHLVYASSSSVYGLNSTVPFSEHHHTEHPGSLYAATKKSNEMMAHAYSILYGIPTTGLRFFTVYGPNGRPDMAPALFTDAIRKGKPIKVFNYGDMYRDFTFIDDVAESVARVALLPPKANPDWDSANPDPAKSSAPYAIYNVGNSSPVKLMDFIREIEKALGRKAKMEFLPMQPGDLYRTYADSSALEALTGYRPSTPLSEGIKSLVDEI